MTGPDRLRLASCRSLVSALLLLLAAFTAPAQEAPNWLRYPAISPDGQSIAFTFKGDVCIVPAAGGEARALTSNQAYDFMPAWSRDGQTVAFASDRHGNFDVFVVAAAGGEPRRLTFHSGDEYPYAFSADNQRVIFGGLRQDLASHRQFPTGSQPELYSVPVAGGRVGMVWTFPAEAVQVSGDGQKMVYHDKKGGENEYRKHHTSSIARDIWLYDRGSGGHTRITAFAGEDRNPVFSDGDRSVCYLSEESGCFNVHELSLADPHRKRQLTFFKNAPVRFLSRSAGGTLCFGWDGEIYTLAPGGQPRKVAVALRGEESRNNTRFLPVAGDAREMAVAPDGKEVAYVVRGEVFVSAVEGGVTRRITSTPGQERFVSYSPDGSALLYAGEREGRWQIYQTRRARPQEPHFYAATVLLEEPLFVHPGNCTQPRYSPDGKEVAFIEDRASLSVYDIAGKRTRTLLTPDRLYYMQDGDQHFDWSPDGKWLLVEYSPVMANSEALLVSADGRGQPLNLTGSGHNDFRPLWANEGRQMLWFSTRDGLRSYANSGRRQADVYSMFFTREAWDRFNLSKEDYALLKETEEKEKEKKKEEEKGKKKEAKPELSAVVSPLRFDWENLADRKARLTVASADLADAVLSKDGETLYSLARFEKGYHLWSTALRTRETKLLVSLDAHSGQLRWDKEMKNLFLLADGRISRIHAETGKRESVEMKGEMQVDRAAEMRAMFEHVWQRTRTGFYTSGFHGVDWDRLGADYRKHLPSIGSGREFADLLSEMLGELNSSHSGARHVRPDPEGDATASLGIFADPDHAGDGIRIVEVLAGGPLDKAAIRVGPGMIVEQIDGEAVSAGQDVARYLNRKAGRFTLLQVFDPATGSRSSFVAKPVSLDEEEDLLYRRWVRRNEEDVERLSGGRLGYVHIPGMGDGPYRDVYERMMGRFLDRQGMVVDTRFNGGGDLVSDLAMFFTGTPLLQNAIERRALGWEPAFRWTKPTVALFNEANYSDGHCFACGYQGLAIGRTVGMPTPGTCSWAGWERLPDGETVWGMVPVSVKDNRGNWLENRETVPDYVVKNEPLAIAAGRDQQLEKAVEVLLEVVGKGGTEP